MSITAGWRHIELGAANYGAKGHSDGKFAGGNKYQYHTLFRTLDELVSNLGETGIFYLNDLEPDDCTYAVGKLRAYIKSNHPNANIRVVELPKSYRELDVRADCGVDSVDSVHLKNPDQFQLRDDLQIQDTTGWMEKVATVSKTGLRVITPYSIGVAAESIPESGQRSVQHLRRDCRDLDNKGFLYFHPNGETVEGWDTLTKSYTVRVGQGDEIATVEERKKLEEAKTALRTKIGELEKKAALERKKELEKDPGNPVSLMLKQLSNQKEKLLSPSFIKKMEQKIKALDIQDLEERYSAISVEITQEMIKLQTQYFDAIMLNKKALAKHSIVDCLDPFSSVSGNVIDDFSRMNTNPDPKAIWEKMGLETAYKAQFNTPTDFWSSEKSMVEIFNLLTRKTADTNPPKRSRSILPF